MGVDIGEAVALVFRDGEVGIGHPQRFEDVAGDELHIVLAGDDLDDAPENGDADVAVDPLRARLIFQVLAGVRGHRVLQGQAQGPFIVGDVADRVRLEARSMVHQLPDSGWVFRRMGRNGAVGQLLIDGDVFKLGQVVVDGSAQIELALLDQHHRRDAGKVFGHGHDLEDCVFAHRLVVFDIGETDSVKGDDLAVAGDEVDCAGDHPLIDQLLQTRSESAEAPPYRGRLRRRARGRVSSAPAKNRQQNER